MLFSVPHKQLSSLVGVEPVKPSQLLKSGNISGSGSTIVIHCEFLDVLQEVSCVLVYREYGSTLLTVVDIPQLLHFPVSLAVDNPENHTFALFGKHPVTGMEEHPVITVKFSDLGVSGTKLALPPACPY